MVSKKKVWRSVIGCRLKRILLLIILGGVFVLLEVLAFNLMLRVNVFETEFVVSLSLAVAIWIGVKHSNSNARLLGSAGQLISSASDLGPVLSKALVSACNKRGIKLPPVRMLKGNFSSQSPVIMYTYAQKGPCLLFCSTAVLFDADEMEANIAHELRHTAWNTRWLAEWAKCTWRWLMILHCYALVIWSTYVFFGSPVTVIDLALSVTAGILTYVLVAQFVKVSGLILIRWPHYSSWAASLLQTANTMGNYRFAIAIGVALLAQCYLISIELADIALDFYGITILLFVAGYILIRTYQRQVEFEADALAVLDQENAEPLMRLLSRKGLPPNLIDVKHVGIARVIDYQRDHFNIFGRHPTWQERIRRLSKFVED